jgi:hypothetical protein
MFAKWSLISGFGVLLLSPTSALTIPPPPVLPQQQSVRAALERLSPFQGRWSAVQRISTPMGTETIFPVRDVRQVADVLVLVEGAGEAALSISMIDFDPRSGSYRLFRPGFRDPLDPPSSPMVPLRVGPGNTLEWSRPYIGTGMQFVSIRTTVTVTDGQWHEKLESVRPDGSAVASDEYLLTRQSAPPGQRGY